MSSSTTSISKDTDSIQRAAEDHCERYRSNTSTCSVDLDDSKTLSSCIQAIQAPSTHNFAVVFDEEMARISFNVTGDDLNVLLLDATTSTSSTRWINIWQPSKHAAFLEQIGKRYDFSPRLLALMCSKAVPQSPASSLRDQAVPSTRASWFSTNGSSTDEERQCHGSQSSRSMDDTSVHNNIYRLASEIWHYTTIDFGRNYMCVGYNSLYGVLPADSGMDLDHLPSCIRVWTWLILCDDRTVLTINEDIFPQVHLRYTAKQLHVLRETRRNIVNVCRSLSLVDSDPLETRNPMRLLPIRARLGSTPAETIHHESNAPGLLFYYLFENWQNSYNLITRRESRYGLELERLREQMFVRPRLAHINRLHTIGQELGVLKRHYGSYIRIIERLLEPRPSTLTSLQDSRIAEGAQNDSIPAIEKLIPVESSIGVTINTATRMRFRRLKDLIDLYALSELQEYLTQKDALVSLNFNLLTLKESLDVERLTKITLLLTKATFMFLPVSLMTSYFGLALDNTTYTVPEFWTAFAVILFISWTALFIFGLVSGSAESTAVVSMISKCFRRVHGSRA